MNKVSFVLGVMLVGVSATEGMSYSYTGYGCNIEAEDEESWQIDNLEPSDETLEACYLAGKALVESDYYDRDVCLNHEYGCTLYYAASGTGDVRKDFGEEEEGTHAFAWLEGVEQTGVAPIPAWEGESPAYDFPG